MCFLPSKFSYYPSRPVPVPELFCKYPTRPVPKLKTPTRRTLITPLLLQMSLTFSPFIMGGLEGRRGEKLQKNFTLVFHLKSDWKWDLLFRSSSCASSLSQVEKKTKKMKPSTQLDWGNEGRHKICFTAVNFDYHNNGPKLFFLKRLKRTFSQAFCRPVQCRPLNTVMFEHKSVSNRAQCVQFFNPSKEHVQSHVFQFYQVASPGDVTAPSKTKVNSAT